MKPGDQAGPAWSTFDQPNKFRAIVETVIPVEPVVVNAAKRIDSKSIYVKVV